MGHLTRNYTRSNAISLLALLSLLCACVASGQQVHPNAGKAKVPVKPAGGKAKVPVHPAGGKGKVAVKPAGGKGKGKMPAMGGGAGGKKAAMPVGPALVPGFKKFVDPLFIPPVIDMRAAQKKNPGGEGPLVTVSAYSTTWVRKITWGEQLLHRRVINRRVEYHECAHLVFFALPLGAHFIPSWNKALTPTSLMRAIAYLCHL